MNAVEEVTDAVAATAIADVAGGESSHGIRTAVLSIWTVVRLGQVAGFDLRKIDNLRSLLAYGVEHYSRKRKVPVDIKAMVERWVPIIRGLATSHSKDELDRCEFEMDQHLTPLLSAPVRQIREFYAELTAALKADPAVPLFVWSAFEAWHEVVVKKAPDEGVIELKKQLAEEIARLVEADVQPDIGKAIAGALQWRAPEALEKVRDAVKRGAKPRLSGRESCLFLEVGDAMVML